jgi:hypothetical protein
MKQRFINWLHSEKNPWGFRPSSALILAISIGTVVAICLSGNPTLNEKIVSSVAIGLICFFGLMMDCSN